MPSGDKNNITQSTLNQFVATREKHPELTDKQWMEKFPEFNNDFKILETAFSYDNTAKSGKYKTLEELNSKFPEFFAQKKKEPSGKGLQSDWQSVSKYEEENDPLKDFVIPTPEESEAQFEQTQREQFQQTQLPAEEQPSLSQLPSELEQMEILKDVNPEEFQRIENERIEQEKLEVAKKQKNKQKAAKAEVYAFNVDYKATLEEADEMGFAKFTDYAAHFKSSAAEEFLTLGSDKKEFVFRQKVDELQAVKKQGGPVTAEQIEAVQQEADNIRLEKFEDINKEYLKLSLFWSPSKYYL